MRLSAPKKATWLVAVVLGGLGIVSQYVPLGSLSANSYWLVAAGFVILTLATALDGM